MSNWKVGSDAIDPAEYSTARMLSTSFSRIHLLPGGTQVRTLVPDVVQGAPPVASPPSLLAKGFEELQRRLVEWTVREWEAWLDEEEEEESLHVRGGSMVNGGEQELASAALFSSALSLLALTGSLPPEALEASTPEGSSVFLAPELRFPDEPSSSNDAVAATSSRAELPSSLLLTRQELGAGGCKPRLVLVDFLARQAAREWTGVLQADLPPEAKAVPDGSGAEPDDGTRSQLKDLLARVSALEEARRTEEGAKPALENKQGGDESKYKELETEVSRLRQRVEDLSAGRTLAAAVAPPAHTPARPPANLSLLLFLNVVVLLGALIFWQSNHI